MTTSRFQRYVNMQIMSRRIDMVRHAISGDFAAIAQMVLYGFVNSIVSRFTCASPIVFHSLSKEDLRSCVPNVPNLPFRFVTSFMMKDDGAGNVFRGLIGPKRTSIARTRYFEISRKHKTRW